MRFNKLRSVELPEDYNLLEKDDEFVYLEYLGKTIAGYTKHVSEKTIMEEVRKHQEKLRR